MRIYRAGMIFASIFYGKSFGFPSLDSCLELLQVGVSHVHEGFSSLLRSVTAPAVQKNQGVLLYWQLSRTLAQLIQRNGGGICDVAVLLHFLHASHIKQDGLRIGLEGLLKRARINANPLGCGFIPHVYAIHGIGHIHFDGALLRCRDRCIRHVLRDVFLMSMPSMASVTFISMVPCCGVGTDASVTF